MAYRFLNIAVMISAILLQCPNLSGQEVSYSGISGTVEVGTVAVAFSPPRAKVLEGRLAATENISLLAGTKTICVLPYDGWQAKTTIQALPSLTAIRSGLEANKSLRQQRNEVAEELSKKGFEPVDCLAGAVPDTELLFTKVLGGGAGQDLPAYFWLLYANEQHQITVHGEIELLGLARPASGWLPLSSQPLADQVWAVVDAARAVVPGSGVKRAVALGDVKAICVSGSPVIRSEAITASKGVGLDVSECGPPTQSYDAQLQIDDLRSAIGSWSFALTPRGGADDLYESQAKSIEAGMKDLAKAIKKANRH